jgi:hypothetical protein
MSEMSNDVSKRPKSADQSDTGSLQKELKGRNEISDEMVKEKEADSEAIESAKAKSSESSLSVNTPSNSLKVTHLITDTIEVTESRSKVSVGVQNESVDDSKNSDVSKFHGEVSSTKETPRETSDAGVRQDYLKSNQQTSSNITITNTMLSDDLPEISKTLDQTEALPKPKIEISPSDEMLDATSEKEKTTVSQTCHTPGESKHLPLAGASSETEVVSTNTLSPNENPSGTEPANLGVQQQPENMENNES